LARRYGCRETTLVALTSGYTVFANRGVHGRSSSGGGHLDDRGSDCRRVRDPLPGLPKAIQVKDDAVPLGTSAPGLPATITFPGPVRSATAEK
jgi:hypothetical protein